MINQSYMPSSNGLESFIEASPDYELAPIGLGSMRDQAEKLAEYGRYGDIYVVHAAEGETVVPMEVLEANPKIKSLLFDQMSQMGLDPERYVVGSDLNSLNPVTGMPEFFFKKIWKSVKKVLPIVAPIIGNMIAPGIGGLIATGLTTKLTGGSWGDALKATAMAWGTQAVMGGAKSWMKTGDFGKGFMQSAKAPITAAGNLFTGWDGTQLTGPGARKNPLAQGIGAKFLGAAPYDANKGFLPEYDFMTEESDFADTGGISELEVAGNTGGNQQQSSPEDLSRADKIMRRQAELFNAEGSLLSDDEAFKLAVSEADAAAAAADKGPLLGSLSPSGMVGMPSNYADAAIIGGALYAGGAFEGEEPEQPEPEDLPTNISNQPTAEELLAADPDRFRIGIENLNPNIPVLGNPRVPSMFAAQGGTVNYPRRIGQITGPGTGTSDSIPAMLSNGEFVMTKRAVDGAGGPGTMYDLMRNFEMRT